MDKGSEDNHRKIRECKKESVKVIEPNIITTTVKKIINSSTMLKLNS